MGRPAHLQWIFIDQIETADIGLLTFVKNWQVEHGALPDGNPENMKKTVEWYQCAYDR